MRYIGSKESLLPWLEQVIRANGVEQGIFLDLFAGTTIVGRHFKRLGFSVVSNDLMHYAYVLGKAYLETNTTPQFENVTLPTAIPPTLFEWENERLVEAVEYLNNLPPEQGFLWRHYSDEGTAQDPFQRMYFSSVNAGKMDAIRAQVETWHCQKQISDAEYYVLLTALLEAAPRVANISGTYAAFLKFWESRSQKPLTLVPPTLLCSNQNHQVFQQDATVLVRDIPCDVMYLDPPYNNRQYATNYHLMETIARYDSPAIYGKSGLRPYAEERSAYCQRASALVSLEQLVSHATCRLLVLSYSSEGIMPHEDIMDILTAHGEAVLVERPYRRFRSDSDNENRTYKAEQLVLERLYVLNMKGQ